MKTGRRTLFNKNKMELIAKIRNEIERLKEEQLTRNSIGVITGSGVFVNAASLLAFLDTLQEPIKVYRVENEREQKGLWRKFDGTWEPLFDMLTDGQCRNMPMDDSDVYRADGTRWFASAPSTETLQKWFSKRDLEELTAAGFTITEFTITKYKVLSEFEYIFPRESIIETRQLSVEDIYPNILQEPEVDLEKEMDEYFENMVVQEHENIFEDTYHKIARHFANWGAKNAK